MENKRNCPVAKQCGGCRWIYEEYQATLKEKEKRFAELMKPFCKPQPIIGMKDPYHYRNKVHAVFGEDRKHNAISGIYEGQGDDFVTYPNIEKDCTRILVDLPQGVYAGKSITLKLQ